MNKLLSITFAFFSFAASAQTIPNGNFESWSGDFNEPTGWKTMNSTTVQLSGTAAVTKTDQKFEGSFAATIKNVQVNFFGRDTILGGMLYQDVDFTGKALPAYLKGHIKYALAPGEKARISFGYITYKNDTTTEWVIGMKSFTGTSTSYIPFKIETNSFFYPERKSDKIRISVMTFDWKNNAVSTSSNLTIDSLGFVGEVTQPVVTAGPSISNGDFSSWKEAAGIKTPSNWFQVSSLQTADSTAVTQSTDALTGPYALQLSIDPDKVPSYVYTFLKPEAGAKFIHGYSKFTLAPGDTALAYIIKFTKKYGIGGPTIDSLIFTGTQDSYRPFTLNFGGKVSAGDTLALLFAAYNPVQFENFRLEADSKFLVDDIKVSAFPLALEDEATNQAGRISPNPSSNGIFTLRTAKTADLKVYDALGNKTEAVMIQKNENVEINLTSQVKGVYFVSFEKSNKTFRLIY